MERSSLWFLLTIGLFVVSLAVTAAVTSDHYLLLSIVLVAAAMIPFFARFERKQMEARELVLLAVLAAIAAVSRVPFAPLPSVQPTSFVIIVSALVFGAESGFIIGAIAALVSNMFLGQGPWTPWQMFSWGMIGATAGWLRHSGWMKSRWGLLSFGFLWGFVFGWIMNLWHLISLPDAFSWGLVLLVNVQSVYFDLAHALSNVFFLAVFAGSWSRILHRFRKKYGLLQ